MLDIAEEARDPGATRDVLKTGLEANGYKLSAVADEVFSYIKAENLAHCLDTPIAVVTKVVVAEVVSDPKKERVPAFEEWIQYGLARRTFFLGLCLFAISTVSLQATGPVAKRAVIPGCPQLASAPPPIKPGKGSCKLSSLCTMAAIHLLLPMLLVSTV